jgi:hypothetical protein
MGILLVYDVTDESSFNSKFSYRLTISLQILRNLNSLPILLLFYCQHVLLAFSVFAWVISIPVCCLIFVQYMCCMYLCVGNQQHLFLVCFLFHRDEFVKDLLTDIVELLLHLVGLSSIVQHPWISDRASVFLWSDIRNWIRNIEQHASDNVNKILVGNKADMDESKRVCAVSYNLQEMFISLTLWVGLQVY